MDASSVTGAGSLTACGGPLIRVENASNAFLIANKLVIPDIDSGGAVSFTGLGSAPASAVVSEVNKARVPVISLHNAYDTAFGGPASDIITQAPLDGTNPVRNLRGNYTVFNGARQCAGRRCRGAEDRNQGARGTLRLRPTRGLQAHRHLARGHVGFDRRRQPPELGQRFRGHRCLGLLPQPRHRQLDRLGHLLRQLQGIANNKGEYIYGYLFRQNLGNQPGDYGGNGAWYDGRYVFDIPAGQQDHQLRRNTLPSYDRGTGLQANRIDINGQLR